MAHILDTRVIQITPLPLTIRAGAVLLGRVLRGIGFEPSDFVKRLAQPIINRSVDISKARRELGFSPIALDTGIRQTVTWFTQRQAIEEGPRTDGR